MLWFMVGLFVGGFFGFFLASLFHIASYSDKIQKDYRRMEQAYEAGFLAGQNSTGLRARNQAESEEVL